MLWRGLPLEAVIDVVVEERASAVTKSEARDALLDELLRRVDTLNDLRIGTVTAADASPAAKAIAETAHQSASAAAEQIRAGATSQIGQEVKSGWTLWGELVLPDLEGAFEGGLAGVDIAGAVMPLSMPLAATLGVMIGAGIRSGIAFGKLKRPG